MISKEELRQKRKEAYQKAKEKRDADPHYQALREKAKTARREAYRAFKEQQKNIKLEEKRKRVAEKDLALMALLFKASDLEQQDS